MNIIDDTRIKVHSTNVPTTRSDSDAFLQALGLGRFLRADGPVTFGNLTDPSGTQASGLFDKIFGIIIFQSINNQTRFFRSLTKQAWNIASEMGQSGTVGWRLRRARTTTVQGTAGSDSTPLPPSSHNRAELVERLPHFLMSRTSITSYVDYIARNAQNGRFQITEPFTYHLETMRQDMQKRVEWLLLAPSTFPSVSNATALDANKQTFKCAVPAEVARTLMPDDRFLVVGRRESATDSQNPYRASNGGSAALNYAIVEVVRVTDRGGNIPSKVKENAGITGSTVALAYDDVIFKRYGDDVTTPNDELGKTNVLDDTISNLNLFGKGSVFSISFRKTMTSIDDVVAASGTSRINSLAGVVHPNAYNLLELSRVDPVDGDNYATSSAEYKAGRTVDSKTGAIVLDAGGSQLSPTMLDDAMAHMRTQGGIANMIVMDHRTQTAFSRQVQSGNERMNYAEFVGKGESHQVQGLETLKGFDYRLPVVAYKGVPIIEVDDAPLSWTVSDSGEVEEGGRNVYVLDTKSIDIGVMLPTQLVRAGNPILLNALERQVLMIQLMDLRVRIPAYHAKITNLQSVEPGFGNFTKEQTAYQLDTE